MAFRRSLLLSILWLSPALASLALAQVAPPVAPVAVPAPNFGGSVIQLILGLALVLALMVGALWLLKQLTMRRGTASAMLKVVAGTAVGPRERVVIVEVGTTWLVLGVAPGRVTPLAEIPRQAAGAFASPAPEHRRTPSGAFHPASADFSQTR